MARLILFIHILIQLMKERVVLQSKYINVGFMITVFRLLTVTAY